MSRHGYVIGLRAWQLQKVKKFPGVAICADASWSLPQEVGAGAACLHWVRAGPSIPSHKVPEVKSSTRAQPQEVEPRPLPAWAASPWSVRGQLFRLSRSLWELGATPGILVRTLGPWGPGLIQKYARNR